MIGLETLTGCIFRCDDQKTEWRVSGGENEAVLETRKEGIKTGERAVDPEILLNLEALLCDCRLEEWETLPKKQGAFVSKTLILQREKGETTLTDDRELPAPKQAIWEDLERWFLANAAGTLTNGELRFDSFDGGGPVYSVSLFPKGIVTWSSKRFYARENHEELCGAGYEVLFTLHPLRTGVTEAVVTSEAFYGKEESRYRITVDQEFRVTCDRIGDQIREHQ